jgi:hypothetical protein
VGVGAPVGNVQPLGSQRLGQMGGIGHDLSLQRAKVLGLRQPEGRGDGGDGVEMRPPCPPGKTARSMRRPGAGRWSGCTPRRAGYILWVVNITSAYPTGEG